MQLRLGRRRSVPAYAALLLTLCAAAAAETLEPPPESADGADYHSEPSDSLEYGALEVSVGATGRAGSGPRRTRRVRFSSDSLDGTLRQGEQDPLAGGSLVGQVGRGSFGLGRLAPRWGRGLVIGAPAEPWSLSALDRGARARFRGRAGDGVWFERDGAVTWHALQGRFGRRKLAAVHARGGPVAWGVVGDARGRAQASLALERGATGMELALDRAGRWRAEGSVSRSVASLAWTARARAGHVEFESLAEPKRSGPAQALVLALFAGGDGHRLRALGSLWRFAPGITGARAALEVDRTWRRAGSTALGFEEQHGVRRPPTVTKRSRRTGRLRQGWWCEWRTGEERLRLVIRHESWGARAWAREQVRGVTTVRLDVPGPLGTRWRATHVVFRVRRGESTYLPEAESDRLILRALSGAGQRTRLEVWAPGAAGRLHATVTWSVRDRDAARANWGLSWTRRARVRRR